MQPATLDQLELSELLAKPVLLDHRDRSVHKANPELLALRAIPVRLGELDKEDQLEQLECRDLRVRLVRQALLELRVRLERKAALDNLVKAELAAQLEQPDL